MSFCMKKMMLPASSYDAASIIHTKLGDHKGIGMSYFSEGEFSYEKSDAASVRGSDPVPRLNDNRGPIIYNPVSDFI